MSPIGRISGAHVNPAVTAVFWLFRKLEGRLAVTYISAQLAGAVVGCIPLLLWGEMDKSMNFGATTPGESYTATAAFLGEVITTFALVFMIVVFVAYRELRPFTPFMVPFLYGIMVPLSRRTSPASVRIRPEASAHRWFQRSGMPGGSTGLARSPAPYWQVLSDTGWPSAWPSPSCITLTASPRATNC